MKAIGLFSRSTRVGAFALCAGLIVSAAPAQQAPTNTQHYTQTNLVSNQSGVAAVTDPNLINPWGLSRSSGGTWWAADNGSGLSTLYDGTGKISPLVVKVPPSDPKVSPTGSPTGTIFNGGTGFQIAPGKASAFLFVTEDGTISGWNPAVQPTSAVIAVNEKQNSVFKGATLATVNLPVFGVSTFLYAADFRQGRIQIYNSNFQKIPAIPGLFYDSELPAGYAPFNVQNLGGNLYVSYALQDGAKFNELDGAGNGYVDVFTPLGQLLGRLEHGSWFNAPWGMAIASGDFGQYSHDLLVGQFGSGQILAFDPLTGKYLGPLEDAKNQPIAIDGLWGIAFGNGSGAGSATSLYFSAGPNGEQNGLFGSLTPVENPQGNDQ